MTFLRHRYTQLLALTAFLAVIGINALRLKYCVIDLDTWWHLKVGAWIFEHLALPHTGILSRTAANLPWVAYSWGYEVLLSGSYAWFGLIGIGTFGALLTLGVAFAVFWMLRRLSHRFWLACILAGIACSSFIFSGAPRPVFFSQIFYCILLTLLFEAHRTARVELLYWLPPLFLLWANFHIQFIYGLFSVGLFVGVNLVQRLLGQLGCAPEFLEEALLPAEPLFAILALCALATILGPNFYHPYVVVLAYTKAKFAYKVIAELQPLAFRRYSEFAELFLAAAGFYAVGWRKKLNLFQLSLLVVASVVAFRTMRDAWFLSLAAAASIADFPAHHVEGDRAESWLELSAVSALLAFLLLIATPFVHFTTRDLDRAISADFPVNAINYLRRHPEPGPLYNNLNWGGFLMWYLPELPVAIDGRNDLYGDGIDMVFYESESATSSYTTDPYLNEAGVVILESKLPLAKILTVDPRFRLVYHDDIATVYGRRSRALLGNVAGP
jgi:hypothetical protein